MARSNVTSNFWFGRKDCIVCRFNLPVSKRIDTRDAATLIYYLAGKQVIIIFFMFVLSSTYLNCFRSLPDQLTPITNTHQTKLTLKSGKAGLASGPD